MSDGTLITPDGALRLVADAPDAGLKTPTDLRRAAADCKDRADRKRRVQARRELSGRRNARALASREEANRLQSFAQIAEMAAQEVERRKARTVEEAMQPRVRRWLRKLGGRR